MLIKGKEYTEVKDRIIEFRAKFPDWSIKTEVFKHGDTFNWVVFHATVISPGGQEFHGWAYEEREQDKYTEVNFSSWVENCETSAIGRALANMGITLSENRPSLEEMEKVARARPLVVSTPEVKKEEVREAGKKMLKLAKLPGTRTAAMEEFISANEKLKKAVGHDKYFVQALANRRVNEVKDLTLDAMKEITEGLEGLLKAYNEYMGNEDIAIEERKKLALEKLDKMSLLM